MRKVHLAWIITSSLLMGDFNIPAEASPQFLTLPFPEGVAHLSEGWIYETPGPNPFSPECDNRCHKGIDYGAFGVSFPILAAAPGHAIASRSKSYGNIVLIVHDEVDDVGLLYYSLYAHLLDESSENITRKDLDEVRRDIASKNFATWTQIAHRGVQVGMSGRTGSAAFNVHLHFEIERGGYVQNKTDPYDVYATKSFYPGNCAGAYLWLHCPPQSPAARGVEPTFAPKVDKITGTEPLILAVADFDGDERADIAVTIYNHGSGDHLTIFRNTGTVGQLQFDPLPVDIPTGRGPEGLAAGDLNNDGKVDLVAANADSQTVSVLRNTSMRGFIDFQPAFPQLPIATPHRVVIADFDNDGRPDLVVTSNTGRLVSVFHHASDPNTIAFDYRRDFGAGAFLNDLAVADMDGDMRPEILIPLTDTGQLTVFRNNSSPGNVQASALPALAAGSAPIRGIAFSDLNNDHTLDIVIAGIGGVGIFHNAGGGSGVFDLPRTDVLTGTNPDAVAIGDLDKDGRPDVAVANPDENTVSILQNASEGEAIVVTPIEPRLATDLTPLSVVLEDLDGDGWLDIVVANHDGDSVSILLNTTGRQ